MPAPKMLLNVRELFEEQLSRNTLENYADYVLFRESERSAPKN
jgi:hypothetical protein